jgi:copper resistance protein B
MMAPNASGLSDLDAGVRLRYAITRKFAPYIGFAYAGKYGNTARFARQAGETTTDPGFVFGLRMVLKIRLRMM